MLFSPQKTKTKTLVSQSYLIFISIFPSIHSLIHFAHKLYQCKLLITIMLHCTKVKFQCCFHSKRRKMQKNYSSSDAEAKGKQRPGWRQKGKQWRHGLHAFSITYFPCFSPPSCTPPVTSRAIILALKWNTTKYHPKKEAARREYSTPRRLKCRRSGR